MPLRFHNASPKVASEVTPVEPEIDRKMAGNDNTAPMPIKAKVFLGEAFFTGLSPNISPDKKRMANVPTPTENWKIAAKIEPFTIYKIAVKKKVPAKAATE